VSLLFLRVNAQIAPPITATITTTNRKFIIIALHVKVILYQKYYL
jgi:hypothetical protein